MIWSASALTPAFEPSASTVCDWLTAPSWWAGTDVGIECDLGHLDRLFVVSVHGLGHGASIGGSAVQPNRANV